jgi:alpha-beta hydrolase superfamily lysophospholipase
MDYSIRLKNGRVLRGFISSPGEKLKAIVILIHGLGEHIRRYRHWAEMFGAEMVGFTGVDLPGHGLSDGRRGHISSYSRTDEMLDILLDETGKTFPGVPVFLYGHSLGGGILIDYLIRRNPGVKGAIATSPWLRLAFEPPRFKVLLASAVKNILPVLVQPSGLNAEHLSTDKQVVEKYKTDPLVHDRISVSLFHSAVKAGSSSLQKSSEIRCPLLLMHGTSDMICSASASSVLASGNSNIELKLWQGGYHELHNELFRNEVASYITGWMSRLLART